MSIVEPISAPFQVAANIRSTLAGLRARVRLYIVLEALAAVILWLGVTFWLGFALDYLPVLVGANEMPRLARGVLLGFVMSGSGYLLYRYLLARLFVPLSDRNLALLLERKYQQFHDGLVTAVEWEDRPAENAFTANMIARSHDQAAAAIREVRLRELFNLGPLVRNLALATLGALSIGAAYRWNPPGITQAAQRLYLLQDDLWARYAHIEIAGVEVRRPSHEATAAPPQFLAFTNGLVKVPRGANITLKVQADATRPVVPTHCVLNYTTAEHDSGSATLKTIGRVRDGVQTYLCDTKPLAGILSSLDLSVIGYDHRLSGYRIEVVDCPSIIAATMDITYPHYMVDEKNSIRTARLGEPVQASVHQLPIGTKLTFYFTASKPLVKSSISVIDPLAEAEKAVIEVHDENIDSTSNQTSVDYELEPLLHHRTVEVSLLDTDGIASERPFRIVLTAVPDEAPRWELALNGIGSAVTPDVRIPLAGRVTDDYGVKAAWLEGQFGEQKQKFPITLSKAGEVSQAIDFRQIRNEPGGFEIKPGMKMGLVARASDHFNLAAESNLGSSERIALEIVTPEQLLAGLETREISLRRRFEQILEEMNDMRDSLLRVRPASQPAANSDPTEITDPNEKNLSPTELLAREKELRLLRVQRAVQQLRKSAQEVAGVAQAFDAIREELENNRVDTEERKSRLKTLIADPLHKLVAQDFTALEKQMGTLETVLEDASQGPPATELTLQQTNELLAQLDAILQKMLKLESYNEIIDLVRDMIREQQSLRDDTKRQQKRELEE